MKNVLLNFANGLLTREQMKAVKGGYGCGSGNYLQYPPVGNGAFMWRCSRNQQIYSSESICQSACTLTTVGEGVTCVYTGTCTRIEGSGGGC